MLNKKLKKLRSEANLSMEAVGRRIGKSRSAYRGYERSIHDVGHSTPNPDTLLRLCRVFGVSPNEMLEWE